MKSGSAIGATPRSSASRRIVTASSPSLILATTVDDLDGELARLHAGGVTITVPLTSEEWGERAFQVRDPHGVIVQLVDWNAPSDLTGVPRAPM